MGPNAKAKTHSTLEDDEVVVETVAVESKRRKINLSEFIPSHLRQIVFPYHGDFCYSPSFHYQLLVSLMAEGFLPMATSISGTSRRSNSNHRTEDFVLLPKLHQQRSLIRLDRNELHISKSVRKKSKKFTISLNQKLDQVVQNCRKQHGPVCWLYPPLVESFQRIRDLSGMNVSVANGVCPVRFYSVEVYHQGDLIAGELGYSAGRIFTSLTGFSNMDSAGSVQLAALGQLLTQNGFSMWDLGMDMPYKAQLGAKLVAREHFVRAVHEHRCQLPTRHLPEGMQSCRQLIDGPRHPDCAAAKLATMATGTISGSSAR